MQLIIFPQRSDYNYERDELEKNKTKVALTAQYSMFFTGKHAEVIYIPVSINIHIGNDMYRGHYVCDVLDYNTGTWWNCDDVTITRYSGYPKNLYDNLSKENEKKRGKFYYKLIR